MKNFLKLKQKNSMKNKIITGGLLCLTLIAGGIWAADHADAPATGLATTTSSGVDITDVYAFQSPADNSKMVFAVNSQGLMSPSVTAGATFPANVLYEINIDNTGDNIEDLVIQCIVQNGNMRVFGPVAPSVTGKTSTIMASANYTDVAVSSGSSVNIGINSNGTKVFAGPRDDPFFFDLAQFKAIIGGTATGFNSPGKDAFAGTNVMSIVVEVPKTLLGTAASLNVWAETKTK